MEKAKKYEISYEQYEEGVTPEDMVRQILDDPEFPALNEVIIGCWGDAWDDGCQALLDAIADAPEKFSHIEKLFVGDMDYEECEVSWIIQGNYSRIWKAMPQLKELTIKGSSELVLGEICHENLEALTIICGGLPDSVIEEIKKAKLPNLKKLLLYIGIDNYGFEGDENTIRAFLEEADFPKLEYLGIADSEIQDELTAVVLESKFMAQLNTLDLSCGTLTDKGAELLLEKLPHYPQIEKLDLHYHYLSDAMMKRMERELPGVDLDLSEQNEQEVYHGEVWMNAMLTE